MPIATHDSRMADFATIFAHMWYRDFPVQSFPHERIGRADWTIHIGITVRAVADLMGLFTYFEAGVRTDAILRDRKGVVAPLEWEWFAMHRGDDIINEFKKLKHGCADRWRHASFAGFIGYAREDGEYATHSGSKISEWTRDWSEITPPLLAILVHFRGIKGKRRFTRMTFSKIHGGENRLLREQPAYPWEATGSKWAQETSGAGNEEA